ncbi:argininosuccinate synthase [Fusibacter ferrireducens]|uniref:Argininosuccinate synthase n=1 Tax=Fusibacter ferrireducens TaxID=2785058 RepID=A0ABS0A039_9FIRM|nr:argininosuccinate synthase [Fusibacter ferrireducens]MBF4695239.1 argininosuccinate synthase [Fusibacter ferrireducens]
MAKKVVLAYSGGLDTTTIIPWLKENYDYEIIAVCVNVGQGIDELDNLEAKAIQSGASKVYVKDVVEEFIESYIWPTLKANAIYENQYLLGTCMARPLIAKVLVDIAELEGAEAICHGATGKGNDQVRFELAIKALNPDLKIVAPWRLWDIKSREDAIEYCHARGINLPFTAEQSYSRDKNIWHLSHEGLEIEDPTMETDYKKILKMSNVPEDAPDTPEYLTIDFEAGIPVKVNGVSMNALEIMETLNKIGGTHAIGTVDLIENRIVGMKSRGIYETPGGTLLYKAHEALEHICLDRDTYSFKSIVAEKFADLLYNGQWFSPLREALSQFVDSTQETVTGSVKMKLYKGNCTLAGTTSAYALYNASISSFTTGDLYNHHDAEGFINLYGLPMTVRALMKRAEGEVKKAAFPDPDRGNQEIR